MPDSRRRVARMLQEEHVAALALLRRLQSALRRRDGDAPPDADDPIVRALLDDLAAAVEAEITVHFPYEEETLFPYLSDNGAGALADMLTEEHRMIRPLGTDVARLARAAGAEGFTAETWAEFRKCAADFADLMSRHADVEEATLVPLLDDLLNADEDDSLSSAYAAMR